MAERFLPLYLIALGGGTFSIGLLNGLDNLLSALYSLPGGYASDKLGHKKALFLFNLIAMAGYAIVIAFPYWQAVIIGAILFISWTAISLPVTMELVATVLPKNKRTMGISVNSLSSCEGHWGKPAYIKFDGKYHRIWCQAIFHTCIKKNIKLVCEWEWWRWDDRCSIHSHDRNLLELYLEIQDVAKYIYDHRFVFRDMKKHICSLLSPAQKNMKQKELLRFFESHIEEFLIQTNWKIISH